MESDTSAKSSVSIMPIRLDAVSAPQVEGDLVALAEQAPKILVCDFSSTLYVSSAGLRVMLLLTKKQRAAGRSLVLTGLQPEVLDVFRMAGFDTIMDIQDSIPGQ